MPSCWLFHDWRPIEIIGRVWTYRCARCPATKTRVRG